MSGRLAIITPRTHGAAALIACALLAGACCLAGAQEPKQPTKEPNAPVEEKIDRRDPLPADTPRRKAMERLEIKGKDRAIFTAIEDFKPVAAQDKNPREYDAWIEFVNHAKDQHARDLDEFAVRDLVPLDLTTAPTLAAHRTDLVRFDGKLLCVRRLVAPPLLKLNGVAELYEARLVPLDESPLTPVSIVFLDLPESLAAVKAKPPEEWLDASGWVTASGYFFKAMNVPGDRGSAVVPVPLLIGKGLTPLPGPPVPPGTDPTALDKSVRIFKFIQNKAPMIRNAPNQVTWPEIAAYNRVILHASRFSAEELETHATRDLNFASLFEESRRDYQLSNVRFEGRLISLKRVEVNDWLKTAGVTELFEGWLVPADEPRGNPICVLFSEPLAGVEPAGRVNKWVSFAGYSFKLMRYTSNEQDPKNPAKNVDKYAPLLIGRGAISRPDPDTQTPVTWGAFAQVIVFGGVLLLVSAGAFALWYRSGDRQAKAEMAAVRSRNPFDPNTETRG